MKINQLPLMGCFVLAIALIAGCTSSQPIATVLIIDKSASALEDEQFAEIAKESCHTYANALLPTDLARQISVNGTAPKASDLIQVQDPRRYHRGCQPPSPDAASVSTPKGTFSCPAWALADDLSHRSSAASLPVLYVSVIQTNELEPPCPEIWRQLAEDAKERQGKLAIVGSSVGEASNQALNNNFNHSLWQHLKDYPSVIFCEESNVKGCIEQAFIDIRNTPGGQPR